MLLRKPEQSDGQNPIPQVTIKIRSRHEAYQGCEAARV